MLEELKIVTRKDLTRADRIQTVIIKKFFGVEHFFNRVPRKIFLKAVWKWNSHADSVEVNIVKSRFISFVNNKI